MTIGEYLRALDDPYRLEELSWIRSEDLIAVEVDREFSSARVSPAWSAPAAVVVGLARSAQQVTQIAELCDVVLCAEPTSDTAVQPRGGLEAGLLELSESVAKYPRASLALALHLRYGPSRSVSAGLAAESALYSLLQSGPEFAGWLATRVLRQAHPDLRSPLQSERLGSELMLTLARPQVHNAFNFALRDALAEALTLALVDSTIQSVSLRGLGRSFCSGGDLSEFGTFDDVVSAHLRRLSRSPAQLMADLRERTTAHLQGAAIGAGIELAAFASKVTATADTVIALPELSLGLIPGSGGTVSLPRRIGRHRTAWLALTAQRIDATTAHLWGLVDRLE